MRCLASFLVIATACATDPAAAGGDDPPPPNVATGSMEPWQMAAPLPVARANHCSATIGDWLLVIGGNRKQGETFVKTDEIHAGKVAADGTITWQLAGRTPSPVTECTATADGNRLFVIDGLYDREADARQTWTAELDDTGQLAPLVSLGALPDIAISSEAAVRQDALLLMDTVLPADGDRTVTHRATIGSGMLAWTTDDWEIGFRAQAQYAFSDRFAFVLGGYKGDAGNPVTAETFVALIGPEGMTFALYPTRPLPVPIAFGEAVAVDDWVFVAGGRAQVLGAPGTQTVVAAQILSDGTLDRWQPAAALPMARTNHELAVVGDFLVLTGGAANGPGDTTVLVSRVRFPPGV